MNPYFEQMILGASPIELVRLLYQRAIRAVREARAHLAAGSIAERAEAINLGYAVVTELLSSLNDDAAPELAGRLRALYCYIQERLLAANLRQADEPLAEVLGLLTTLAEAWQMPAVQAIPPARAGAWSRADMVNEERLAFTA